jgi:flagellar biosynthetic protein FliQ
MSPMTVVDIGRQALYVTALIGGPMLIFSMVVGLLIGIFQAVTQIHEMTLTFIPKIVIIGLALILFLPWMITMYVDYTVALLSKIPEMIR